MTAKPKDAIAALRHYMADRVWPDMPQASLERVLAWADSIPDEPVVWPAELTRERLEELADEWRVQFAEPCKALRALAAIAPVRKKRVVNLWVTTDGTRYFRETYEGDYSANGWKCVARNVELED